MDEQASFYFRIHKLVSDFENSIRILVVFLRFYLFKTKEISYCSFAYCCTFGNIYFKSVIILHIRGFYGKEENSVG